MSAAELIGDPKIDKSRMGMPIPILMYHQIDVLPPRPAAYRYLTVSPKSFARQMTWLKRLGFQGLSIRDLMPYLFGSKTGRVVGITFDDGYRNVYEHALPVLQSVGFTATNYFVSGQVGGYNAWDEHIGIPYSSCMTKTEMREWASLGHEIGAHTVDHLWLAQVDPPIARRQINESRDSLVDMLGQAVTSFSYPYGDLSPVVRDLVSEAGFSTAVTTRRGRVRAHDDRLLLPRRIIRASDSSLGLLRKCVTG